MPRVSVVIPTHNRPVLLAEALASVRSQTFGDWEAIVVDDASNPPVTVDESETRIRVVRHPSSLGGAASKNTGVDNATAEILAFLDDDDLYGREYLERALDILDRNPDLDVVFMGVTWFGAASQWGQRNYAEAMAKTLGEAQGKIVEAGVLAFDDNLLDALLKSVPMAFQRPVVRKQALERIGLYRPDCLLWDCDWAISAALNARTALLQDGLYRQRAEGQGYSSRGDRRFEHLASGIEIKDRFLADTRRGRYPRHLIPKFRKAAARAWFDLAWHHYQQHDRRRAIGALWSSLLRQFSLSHLKLLVRLVLPHKSR